MDLLAIASPQSLSPLSNLVSFHVQQTATPFFKKHNTETKTHMHHGMQARKVWIMLLRKGKAHSLPTSFFHRIKVRTLGRYVRTWM
jgi:hypothetical protein